MMICMSDLQHGLSYAFGFLTGTSRSLLICISRGADRTLFIIIPAACFI